MEIISSSKCSSTMIISLLILFLSLPSPSLGATKCNAQDKAALMQIKAALNNPYHLASWDPTTDCCSWYDVDCDSNGRITSLTIFDDTAVTGQISPAIGNLPYLQMIDLNRLPNVTGGIPSTIGQLTRLTFLRLKSNKLSGTIPSVLGNLKKLTFLDLSFNSFSGAIPAQLTQLTNLDGLQLNNNNLCGQIPQGGKLQSFDSTSYNPNKCLCGAPLPACSN